MAPKHSFHHGQGSKGPSIPAVLVLGGSGVIGSAVCLRFAQHGWDVGVHYHANHDSAAAVLQKIEQLGREGRSFQANMNDSRQIHTLFDQAQTVWPEFDALVWSVGTTVNRLTIRITAPSEWEQMHSHTTSPALFLVSSERAPGFFPNDVEVPVTGMSSLSSARGGRVRAPMRLVKPDLGHWLNRRLGIRRCQRPRQRHLPLVGIGSPLGRGDAFPGPDQRHAHVLGRTPALDDVTDFIYRLTTTRDISGQVYNMDNRIW